MEAINEFIKPELLVVVPVIYLIGMAFQQSSKIKNTGIPFYLGIISIIIAGIRVFADVTDFSIKNILMATFSAITQGILIAGTTVYFNQLYVQNDKRKSENK